MKYVSDERCRDNRITPLMFENFSEDCAVSEMMWKESVRSDRLQMIILSIHVACWISKATDSHSEYVILISFPRQQWLRERALTLHYTYIACRVL
jgi:hypothetical protein